MVDAAPARDLPTIRVESAASGTPFILMGITAFGSDADVRKLETAAKKLGMSAGRPKTEDGSIEEMLLFDSDTSRSAALSIFRRAREGEFGSLKVEVVLFPYGMTKPLPADAIDIEPADFILDPAD